MKSGTIYEQSKAGGYVAGRIQEVGARIHRMGGGLSRTSGTVECPVSNRTRRHSKAASRVSSPVSGIDECGAEGSGEYHRARPHALESSGLFCIFPQYRIGTWNPWRTGLRGL